MKTVLLLALTALTLPASAPSGLLSLATYTGMCDASAAAAIDADRFVVANDEDNVLRVYSLAHPGRPVGNLDLSTFLSTKNSTETDIEGCARMGDRIYWITSHARNASGKDTPHRQRFFATDIVATNTAMPLIPAGVPYVHLKRDLLREPKLSAFQLDRAAERVPDKSGGWNIEGLAATPEGHLLIAFRNPVPQGRALIVPLLNPRELLAGKSTAAFGEPIRLDLGGLGIRSLERHQDQYLIIAGHHDHPTPARAYLWRGDATPPHWLRDIDLSGMNAEGILFPENAADAGTVYFISDDGGVDVGGVRCKDLKDPEQKRFRSFRAKLDWDQPATPGR